MRLSNRIFGETPKQGFYARRNLDTRITRKTHRVHVLKSCQLNLTNNEQRLLRETQVPKEIQKIVKPVVDKPAMVKLVARKKFLTDMYVRKANDKVIDKSMYPKWISRVKDN